MDLRPANSNFAPQVKHQPASAGSSFILHPSSFRCRAFTLVEMLVVIGIIAVIMSLLLVGVSAARTKARIARVASDMHTIAVALEAYKQDFGDYPRLDYSGTPSVSLPKGPPPVGSGNPNLLTNFPGNPAYIAGGELLAWGLVGPYDAANQTTPAVNWKRGDGKDGMGFRAGLGARGTVYGPYLDVETFLHNPAVDPQDQNQTFRYYYYLHDAFRQPILYFTRTTAATSNNPTALYNINDDAIAFVRQNADSQALVTGRFNAILTRFNPTGPYLLWSSGPDQLFSVDDPNNASQVKACDDILFSGGD